MTPAAPPALPRPSRTEALAVLDDATARLLSTVRTLDDAAVRGASDLPGWTRGHVLTHLARNADGIGNLCTWAATGVETPMYVSPAGRAADIEAGAGRPAADHLADILATAETMRRQLVDLPSAADEVTLRLGSGAEVLGWELALIRTREVEVHHVDLSAGVTAADWSEAFARLSLDQVTPAFAARPVMPFGRLHAPDGHSWTIGAEDTVLVGPPQLLLGWLLGRSDGSGLTPRGRDDVPPAPPWV